MSTGSTTVTSRVLPLSMLIRRAMWAIVAPQHAFRQLGEEEGIPWKRTILLIFLVGFVDTFLRHVGLGKSPYHFSLPDRLLMAAGYAWFDVNQLFLTVVAFMSLQRLLHRPVKTLAPFGVVGFYLTAGLWAIPAVVDPLHPLLHIPQMAIHLPGLPFGGHPVFGYARLSHLLVAPWICTALWVSFRHLLRLRGARQLIAGAILAVILPLGGRLVIEPLPIFFIFLGRQLGWSLPIGGTILATFVGLAGAASMIIRGFMRAEPYV